MERLLVRRSDNYFLPAWGDKGPCGLERRVWRGAFGFLLLSLQHDTG